MKLKSLALALVAVVSLISSPHLQAQNADVNPQIQSYLDEMVAKRAEGKPQQTDFSILPNGLKLYVVSDPATTNAGITVSVGAGLYSDPPGYRGLAHYLEHCLFLGSAKYPVPGEYGKFVDQHQGQYNAFTAPDHTNYIVSIRNEDFPETVDRLADFFVAPLFNLNYVEKELANIQSEYDKNLENPTWQSYFLVHSFYKDSSPHRWWFQGNRSTLGHVPPDLMKEFFNQHYSAENITVVMVGSQSLAELKNLGTKAFSPVPKRGNKPLVMEPLQQARSKPAQFVKAKMSIDKYQLDFIYTLPPPNMRSWETKDLDVLSVAFSEEREGSLVDYLKTRGWVTAVEAGGSIDSPAGMDFEISLTMTPEGYKHWSEIASGTLAYLEQVKSVGLRPEMVSNVKRMLELSYLYDSKSSYDRTTELASAMATLGPYQTYERLKLAPRSDEKTYAQILAQLTPANMDVVLMAPDLEGNQKAEFYDFNYTLADLKDQDWVKTMTPLSGLKFPGAKLNPYLPQNLALKPEQDLRPILIRKTDLIATSIERDNTYKEPMASVAVQFKTGPEFQPSPENTLLNNLYSTYIGLALSRWSAIPSASGYGYTYKPDQNGCSVQFSGYSDRLSLYMREFFAQLFTQPIDPSIFARVKDLNRRSIANRVADDAQKQAVYIFRLKTDPYSYSDRDVAALLEQMTPEKLEAFRKNIFASGQINVLGYGNLATDQLKEFSTWLEKNAPTKASHELKSLVVAQAPLGVTSYRATRSGANNVWFSEIDLGENSAENIAQGELLGALIGQPFYAHMRTEKNFGYIVSAGLAGEMRQVTLYAFVQSQSPSPDISAEGHRWMGDEFIKSVQAMPKVDFESIRASILTRLRAKPESSGNKFGRLLVPLLYPGYPSNEEIAKVVEKIPQEDLVQAMETRVLGPGRHEFSIFLDSTHGGAASPLIPAAENEVPTLQDYWARAKAP